MTDEVKNLNRDFTSQDSRGLLEASSSKVSGLAVKVPSISKYGTDIGTYSTGYSCYNM